VDMPPISDGLATVTVAFMAAMAAALSWLGNSAVAALLWYYNRRTKEIELVVALGAEINTSVETLTDYAKPESTRKIVEGLQADPGYKIFIPLDREYFIFERVKADISLLPEDVILPVVRFYDEIGGFDILVTEFQAERFEAFPVERRARYVQLMQPAAASVVAAGEAAIALLEAERDNIHKRRIQASAAIAALVLLIALAIVGALVLAAVIYVY
jgi:hypothetical protein